ncbi:hypothetical protein [Maribacter sp. 2307ULW6-5]|uniref:hypothetical protein n=1 Tax=Maribacter sp. 2307ULW6-5 TaxID=3386275 RepID=UPI0039BCE067
MMEDELIAIWQSSPKTEQIKFERSRLMIDVQLGVNRLQKSWRNMLIREGLAATIGIPIFTYIAITHPFALTRMGSALIVLSILYIILWLYKTDRQKPNSYAKTYLAYLLEAREILRVQKKSLENVLYWYVLPLYPGLFLFLLGFVHIPEKTNIIVFTASLAVAMAIGVHFLNKWAARKYFAPQLKKLDELIAAMEE